MAYRAPSQAEAGSVGADEDLVQEFASGYHESRNIEFALSHVGMVTIRRRYHGF